MTGRRPGTVVVTVTGPLAAQLVLLAAAHEQRPAAIAGAMISAGFAYLLEHAPV